MSARHRPHDRHDWHDRPDRHDRRDQGRSGRTRPNAAANERELERTLDDLLGEISRLPAPDVSQTVLARLGYRPIDRRTLRRRRIASIVRRVGGVTLSLMVLGTGFFVVDAARRSSAPAVAIDQAVRDSVERRTELLGGVAAGLRPISELPGRLAASLAPAARSDDATAAVPQPTRVAAAAERSPWPPSGVVADAIAESRSEPTVASSRPLLQPRTPVASPLWPRDQPLGRPAGPALLPVVPSPQGSHWHGDWRPGFRPDWPIAPDAPGGLDAPLGRGPLGPVAAIAPLKKT